MIMIIIIIIIMIYNISTSTNTIRIQFNVDTLLYTNCIQYWLTYDIMITFAVSPFGRPSPRPRAAKLRIH